MADVRRLEPLTREVSLALLGSVPLGRVIFTSLALPAVRPVNHLVDGGQVVFRAHDGAAVAAIVGTGGGTVVAYQADLIDPAGHGGWSVIVIGRARLLTGARADRFRRRLRPWVNGPHGGIIAVGADIVDGFRLAHEPGGQP